MFGTGLSPCYMEIIFNILNLRTLHYIQNDLMVYLYRLVVLFHHPCCDSSQDGRKGQQEEDCAASGIKSPGSCQLSVNYLGDDDETSSGKSESQVSIDYKDS